jgi:hypothetical protein
MKSFTMEANIWEPPDGGVYYKCETFDEENGYSNFYKEYLKFRNNNIGYGI